MDPAIVNPFHRASRRRELFSDLVRKNGTAMTTLARRLVGAGEAEDVVQAALASAWKHFGAPEAIHSPRRWLLRFVVHECGNLVGRRMRRPSTAGLEDADVDRPTEDIVTILQKELACSSSRDPRPLMEYLDDDLSRALRALTENERTTLMLRSVAEYSYKEISEAMGVPTGTVMSRLCRAREKVRVELGRRNDASPSADASGHGSQGAPGVSPCDSETR